MTKIAIIGCGLALAAGVVLLAAETEKAKEAAAEKGKEMRMPEPQTEHQWLQKQLVGEWDSVVRMHMQPGMDQHTESGNPPQETRGSESVRPVGGFWVLAENKGTFMDKPFSGFLTLGYDPEKKQYVGTWVDSVSSQLWKYEGTRDEAGRTLTLNSEGRCPTAPGKLSKFKEVMEFKSKDHRVFTSSMQQEDGQWTPMMTINYYRKGASQHEAGR